VTAFNRQDPNLAVFNRLQVDNTGNNVAVARINGMYQPMLQVLGLFGQWRSSCCTAGICGASGKMMILKNGVWKADVGGVVMASCTGNPSWGRC